jgi:hypothetical protein
MCLCDESFTAKVFVYATVQLTYSSLEKMERECIRLKSQLGITGEIKWHSDTKLRVPVLEIVAQNQPFIRYYVVHRKSRVGDPERERRKCLQELFYEVGSPGSVSVQPIILLDQRELTLNRREREFIEALGKSMRIPPYFHASSSDMIGLQCIDFVAGAIRSHEEGVSSVGYELIKDAIRLRKDVAP